VSLRGALVGTLGVLALALVPAASGAPASEAPAKPGSQPRTPIKHFIVLMQENHTFDNYFGTYPGVDGIPADTCMPVDPTAPGSDCVKPFHIGDNKIQPADLDHSFDTYKRQYRGGQMDGFVHALDLRNQEGRLAMGYYDGRDLPYHWNVADQYVLFDRFFSSAASGSFMNHMYWVTGGPGPHDRIATSSVNVPTIFDRLEKAGVSWKFYVQNYEPALNYRTIHQYPGNRTSQVVWVPLLNMDRYIDDPKLARHIVDLSQYFVDLRNGTLPDVAYIAPSGPSEHPPSSLTSGQAFVRTLITSLMESPAWNTSAFMYAYDDWGGWYDHVKPPQVDEHGLGFRVPALLVSPYAKKGYVDNTQLDFTSMLKFIEQNWGLQPLTKRDAEAKSFVGAFDFSQEPRQAVIIPAQRGEPPAVERATSKTLIYAGYGLACLITLGLMAAGAVTAVLRRRRSPDAVQGGAS
jgi:phospholipase C